MFVTTQKTATAPPWLSEFFLPMGGPAAQWRHGYRETVNLANNELRHPGVAALIRQAGAEVDPIRWVGYPSYGDFRSRFAELLGLTEQSLFLTAGSDQSYRALLQVFGRPGRIVVTQTPNYVQLFDYARLLGLRISGIPYRRGGSFDLGEMLDAIASAGPGSIVAVSNPNGPTGYWWNSEQLRLLANTCLEHRCLLIMDEAYAAYAPETALPMACEYPHVVVMQSFSKAYGLAGARFAVNICGDYRIADAVQSWNVSNPISGPTLTIAARMLEERDRFAAVHSELNASRTLVSDTLSALLGGIAMPSAGNFATIRCPSVSAAERFTTRVGSRGFAIRRLNGFGLPDLVRVTAADADTTAGFLDIAHDVSGDLR